MSAPIHREARIAELELDPENPRLPEGYEYRGQQALLEVMARDYSLVELARSFVDNGYFQEEPLVVVPNDNKFRVVEGNRRLAALKLLSDPALVDSRLLGSEWSELVDAWQQRPIESVPVLVYERRDDIVPFLGFRHISGVRPWSPREKARFINGLVESGVPTFTELARMVGSPTTSVRDSYVAYRILRQARDEFDIDTTRLEEDFGVFLRALSSAPVRHHLGIDITRKKPAELFSPIPPDRGEQLREIVEWIFGTRQINPVIRDSRQITRLGIVLASESALETLRASSNLELAIGQTGAAEASLLDHLSKASFHLDEVKRDVDRHSDNERVRELVVRCQRSVSSILKLIGIGV